MNATSHPVLDSPPPKLASEILIFFCKHSAAAASAQQRTLRNVLSHFDQLKPRPAILQAFVLLLHKTKSCEKRIATIGSFIFVKKIKSTLKKCAPRFTVTLVLFSFLSGKVFDKN